jgi:site-specific recombinase XerD
LPIDALIGQNRKSGKVKSEAKNGAGDEIRTRDFLLGKETPEAKLLDKLSVAELAKSSKMSKQYISQVKNGKRPPSPKLLEVLAQMRRASMPSKDYYALFLKSREAMGVSYKTLSCYKWRLSKYLGQINYLKAARSDIESFLNTIPANQNGLSTRDTLFRTIKTFYRWLNTQYGLLNPMIGMSAPILGKPILPSLDKNQVLFLIEKAHNTRDKAIIALFTESGLRLFELVNINLDDIDWENRIIKVLGKGRKEAYAPFGELSQKYLTSWLAQYTPEGNIWGTSYFGIQTMLRRLENEIGLPCNPHTFRRTFACLLRKAGIDTMTIKDLGRWESLEMVQRYTRSVNFRDSLKFYKAPLS